MDLNLEETINVKQVLNQVESVLKDVSNLKEKQINNSEEYEKIKMGIEHLQTKTKSVKHQIENYSKADVESIDLKKLSASIESANKRIEQYRTDFEHLKKNKLPNHVSPSFSIFKIE